MTAPYLAGTDLLLRGPLRQAYAARCTHPSWAAPLELDVIDVQASWDETRAPRCRATVTARVPDQATLDLLDPRTGVRLVIDAGYIRPDLDDVQTVANLGLRSRQVSRPSGLMVLDGAGDEALVIENTATTTITPGQATVAAAIQNLITAALVTAPDTFTSTIAAAAPDSTAQLLIGDSYWSLAADLAARVGADLYDDGRRRWVLEPRPTTAGRSELALQVGAGGTITRSDAELTREGLWANAVLLTYTLPAGTKVYGLATTTSGPSAVAVAGRKLYTESREVGAITQTAATAAAVAVLRRLMSRGRSLSVDAVAAWWLRPGHTVTVKLPTGPQERHLVSAVDFDGGQATMTVRTRLPDLATITGE